MKFNPVVFMFRAIVSVSKLFYLLVWPSVVSSILAIVVGKGVAKWVLYA